MVSSACPVIICILLVVSTPIFAQSQSAPERLTTGTNIAGKVTIKGKGASGIAVALLSVEESSQQLTRYKAFTDDSGNYRITNVPPGKYRVLTGAPAYTPAKQFDSFKTLLISKGEIVENIDFDLVRGGVITGKVTDSDGRPVIEERVSLEPIEFSENSIFSIPWNIQTDDRGIYRIFGVPAGKYRISAGREDELTGRWDRSGYKRTYYSASSDASQLTTIEVAEGSETTGVDITLGRPRATYSASGRVIDGETGKPLANLRYGVQMFVNPTSTSSHSGPDVSNSDGEFKLDNLIPGKYAVLVEPPSESEWRVESLRFEITDHDIRDLIVKASKGASVSGVIVLEGTQDKDVLAKLKSQRLWVHVINEVTGTNASQSNILNEDGSFRVAGLQVGTASFGFSAQGFEVVRVERNGIVQAERVQIREREQLTGFRLFVNYGNGSIRGVIKLANGTPPPNSRFSFWFRRVVEAPGPFASGSQGSVEVDARGQFSADGLLPGTYEVHAGLYISNDVIRKMHRTKQQVVVTSGGVTDITLILQPDPE